MFNSPGPSRPVQQYSTDTDIRFPLDSMEFVTWAQEQPRARLLDLQLQLSAVRVNLEIQVQDAQTRPALFGPNSPRAGWASRLRTKLSMTEWRLATIQAILDRQPTGCQAFQEAARSLLDSDTYATILEAANAARVS